MTRIAELLAAPNSKDTGRALLEFAEETRNQILSGGLMIGIVSVEVAEQVPQALRKAGECGMEEAWIKLAWWCADPPIDEPDLEEADRALQKAVEVNAFDARLELARHRWFRRRDDATEAERKEAFGFVKQELDDDPEDGDLLHLLGLLTCGGFGTQEDPTAAFELQKRAADLDCADAMFEMYVHLSTGLGVPEDEKAAFAACKRAAEVDHPRALYNMGAFYARGQHVKQDSSAAAKWYERAAEAGSARGAASLAAMYATGDGVKQNREQAEEWFGEAEALGFDTDSMREKVGMSVADDDDFDDDDDDDFDDDDDDAEGADE